MDNKVEYNLIFGTNLDTDLCNRLTRLEVLKVIKKYKLGISPSKLIKKYRERRSHNGSSVNDLREIIKELKRDSSITKLLNNNQ